MSKRIAWKEGVKAMEKTKLTFKLCYGEPVVVASVVIPTVSVTGKPISKAVIAWFSYVVLPR